MVLDRRGSVIRSSDEDDVSSLTANVECLDQGNHVLKFYHFYIKLCSYFFSFIKIEIIKKG